LSGGARNREARKPFHRRHDQFAAVLAGLALNHAIARAPQLLVGYCNPEASDRPEVSVLGNRILQLIAGSIRLTCGCTVLTRPAKDPTGLAT
jgi:hypothetical protein